VSTLAEKPRLLIIEALRALAAFYILVHHAVLIHVRADAPSLARGFVFGQAAVMLFFLLSGFVIYYSSFGQDPNVKWKSFLIRRFRRIYPVFLLALIVSYLSACIRSGAIEDPRGWYLLGNLLMLQDQQTEAGNWFEPYWDNTPLWSLGYEWAFYMMFYPIARFVAVRWQKGVVVGLGLVGFAAFVWWPNPVARFLTYFVIWWLGVELARDHCAGRPLSIGRHVPMMFVIAAFGLLWYAVSPNTRPGWLYEVDARRFATVLALLGAGVLWYKTGLWGKGLLTQYVAPLAGVSYAVYVLHFPLLTLAAAAPLTGLPIVDLILWVLPLILAVSYLAEQKLQPVVNRWLRA